MNKEAFHKKWYYRLLQVLFFGSFIFFSIALILLGIFESDVEIAGFFWSGVLAIVYWVIKKIFYYTAFAENILPKKNKN